MINEIFKKFVVLATTVAVESKIQHQEEPSLCRPSELPIYTDDEEGPLKCENETGKAIDTEEAILRYMENMVLKSQHKYEDFRTQVTILKHSGDGAISYTKGYLDNFLGYLRKEENSTQRLGVITVGALFGLLLGRRKGFIKKTLYATAGSLSVAAACYPQEAKEITNAALSEAKEILEASYNLLGVEQPEVIQQTLEIGEESHGDDSQGEVKDPLEVIKDSHDEAVKKSCHCPIGSCLNRSDEVPPPAESSTTSDGSEELPPPLASSTPRKPKSSVEEN